VGTRTDLSKWPIVVHTNEGAMGAEETKNMLDSLTAVLDRRERYVCIFDSSKMSTFRMGDRDRIVTWLRDNDKALRRYSIGTGVVLSSATLRFVISSVLLVYTPASPIKVFPDMVTAMAWARAQITTDSLRAPVAAT
jgi:hypothetical protein